MNNKQNLNLVSLPLAKSQNLNSNENSPPVVVKKYNCVSDSEALQVQIQFAD